MIDHAHGRGRLYHLDCLHVPVSNSSSNSLACVVSCAVDPWHRRLGHISKSRLKSLFHNGALSQVLFPLSLCTGYKLVKHLALPFNNSLFQTTSNFQLVHSDIWGPTPIPFNLDIYIMLALLMMS